MDGSTSDPSPRRPSKGRPSRRTFLIGGLGAVALAAVGVPVAEKLTEPHDLVTQLLAEKPFSIAHRGGSLDWPEFSLEGYRKSVAAGVEALEISLARSADGVWFGLHDPTLDRTSGTTDFVAAQHDWAEISRYSITAAGTNDPAQAAQPYLRFEDLVTAFGGKRVIFVDPKVVDPVYFPQLLAMMDAVGSTPTQNFIAKSYCTATDWADAARTRGYTSWGYYYGANVEKGSTPLSATEAKWDLLGMDVAASPTAWSSVLSYRKLVIAHLIANKSQAGRARDEGASGLMVSGVREVLG